LPIPFLDKKRETVSVFSLSDLEETFLNPQEIYYFRVRAEGGCWSIPVAFQVLKPSAPKEIHFCADQGILTWTGDSSPTTEYLIFGSNALDFIPEVYSDKQVNALCRSAILASEPNHNFLLATSQCQMTGDAPYSYYRIIAKDKGQLSVPSPLIYTYGFGNPSLRTQLQPESCLGEGFAIRKPVPSTPYIYNPHVPYALWQELEPYFLPEDHPVKAKLDKLFQKERITLSRETFQKAGFGKPRKRADTNIVVGKNPILTGFLIKAYLDTQPSVAEWVNWLDRIQGAEAIRACIKRHRYTHLFKVPRKWIYPLPADPSPPLSPEYNRKNFILVVEDMRVLNHEENCRAYEKEMDDERLNALYVVLTEVGLIDSVYLDNTPFTRDGKMAFIDTEHYHKGPIDYERLSKYLSPSMRIYWRKLVNQGGPQP
jgi:hypothetical protein